MIALCVVLQVYAVEASAMAEYTRQLVKQNGCEEVVTVLQGRAEDIELPEQVDVLVSEWMGNCLLVVIIIIIIIISAIVWGCLWSLRGSISVLL